MASLECVKLVFVELLRENTLNTGEIFVRACPRSAADRPRPPWNPLASAASKKGTRLRMLRVPLNS